MERKAGLLEKAGIVGFVTALGGFGLYLGIGGIGTSVSNHSVSLNSLLTIEGNSVRYEERLPANAFWRRFMFVDKDGRALITVTTPQGGLVARLTDNNNNCAIEDGDVVELLEQADSITGIIQYHHNKVIDSDGKTEFTKPSTVFQALIIERGRQERAKWSSWLQTHYPAIKAKLNDQQYRQQRR